MFTRRCIMVLIFIYENKIRRSLSLKRLSVTVWYTYYQRGKTRYKHLCHFYEVLCFDAGYEAIGVRDSLVIISIRSYLANVGNNE